MGRLAKGSEFHAGNLHIGSGLGHQACAEAGRDQCDARHGPWVASAAGVQADLWCTVAADFLFSIGSVTRQATSLT